MDKSYAVLMKDITKKFSTVLANYKIDFDLKKGEIHALLGENGAGKTTLMRILYGELQPDEGEIYVWGQKVSLRSPKDALNLGISMVHQHFKLVDSLTVAEHLALCTNSTMVFSKRKVESLASEVIEKFSLKVDLDAYIWQLSAGEKQRVEIIKALVRGAKILILDEPTSSLSPIEVRELFSILRKLRDRGYAIVFISHKLKEVLEISDRITVLRKGRKVATLSTREADVHTLAKLMIGDSSVLSNGKRVLEENCGEELLKVENLYVENDRGWLAVRGVNFAVKRGEIFGVVGVAGNGQKELAESIAGLRKPLKGEIFFKGVRVTEASPRILAKMGLAYIPEESARSAVVPELTLAENSILRYYWRFSEKGVIRFRKVEKWARNLIEEYDIKAPGVFVPAKVLSGGNLQKLVIARELSVKPELVVAVNPTSGLDISASSRVKEKLRREKKRGAGILLFTEDIDEALELCDRIAVMYKGRFAGVFTSSEADFETLGLLMAGVKP